MKITGSIVLYQNDRQILKDAINSFLATSHKCVLYLIDNSPTDDLRSISEDDRIVYIFNQMNLGFGKAHNIAINKSLQSHSNDYHFILNPDIYFKKKDMDSMITFMEENKNIGHLMPKIKYPDGNIQYLCKRNPTPMDLFARRFLPKAVQKIFKKRMDYYEYRDYDYDKIIYDVPYFSGCFMLFRNSVLNVVGGFDERIFMYIEDADITRRFLQVSNTVYYPDAEVFHHYGKGSYKNFKLMLYNIHGAYIYFKKWGW
ncbi:glycosyltransferase family 2 protein [Chryseobacterium wangxinyae]|uniref:glycosyltransferase n=1 Tax=Chryseobacterium sp. CY350 TaxID=2997336 RepID=UPI00226D4AC9|nr:glycosyltransferase family 2 protein [Chryseobacterium sp. CY350]MCY0977108.1 glycosyltransferase family 2 protein [Chryseobacterium sp. CY350]WBZ97105.1 glycosyltransferase family 2 protein [Chryseobacterium sp. CY350]